VPIRLAGVGPDRDQVIWMGGEPVMVRGDERRHEQQVDVVDEVA
jgi:hypothetical protein